MAEKNLQCILECVLFAAGEAVKTDKLAEIVGENRDAVIRAMEELTAYYNKENRGFSIIEIDDGYQMCTRPTYYTYVQALAGIRRQQGLSNAAMEALSIIAYNQPVTRGAIEYVRGVNSDYAVARLLERGLIEEHGRLDAPGKPILFVTTNEFLRTFGLKSLEDLPDISTNVELEEADESQLTIDV